MLRSTRFSLKTSDLVSLLDERKLILSNLLQALAARCCEGFLITSFQEGISGMYGRTAKLIVTHPGRAHRDEFMACCLLIAAGEADRIERRDCDDEDLNDPNVIVLDQGGRHEPELMNFDHHQLPRDAAPTCSITLILEHLLIEVDQARQIWGWLEFSELLDSKGPSAAAEKLGSNPDALFAAISPVETTVLRWFQECWYVSEGQSFWGLMHRIGSEKLDYLKKVTERLDRLYDETDELFLRFPETEGDCGLDFVDATCIDRDDNPTMGLEIFCQQTGNNRIAGTITQDDRGDGLTLFRRKGHPRAEKLNTRLDFSRLEGMDGVVFAHKGGFLAKLAAGVDPVPMLKAAIVPDEPEVPLVLQRKQHVIDVRLVVNSEPVPGWGHDPQDMVDAAARAASEVLGSYDPIVTGSEVKDLKVEELTDSETAAILRHMLEASS